MLDAECTIGNDTICLIVSRIIIVCLPDAECTVNTVCAQINVLVLKVILLQ